MDLPRLPSAADDNVGARGSAEPTLSEGAWEGIAHFIRREPWFKELTRDDPRVHPFLHDETMRDPGLRAAIAGAVCDWWRLKDKASSTPPLSTLGQSHATAAPLPEEITVDSIRRPGGGSPQRPPRPSDRFSLANARAGVTYGAQIVSSALGPLSPGSVRDVRLSPEFGLQWDAVAGLVVGTPAQAGDCAVAFEWHGESGVWREGWCTLIVVPDPDTLWKEVDPPGPDKDIYYKPNEATSNQDGIVAASCRGRSHAHTGLPRDDDFFFGVDNQSDSGWSVMVVCDGAGSAPASRWGSYLASKAFGDSMLEQLKSEPGIDVLMDLTARGYDEKLAATNAGRRLHDMFREAARLAVRAIEEHALAKQRNSRDYATTLLAAVVNRLGGRNLFCASLWIGDGAIVVYEPGNHRLMGKPDGGEYAGQTRFLDEQTVEDPSFASRVSVTLRPAATAVALMTDGVSDPWFKTESELSSSKRWDELFTCVEPLLGAADADKRLLQWMKELSEPGHHDDRTIVVWRTDGQAAR